MSVYNPWWPTPAHWRTYSDPLTAARTKTLRKLLYNDKRIIGFTIEPDGVFIYTDSSMWCDDAGSGTFRGDTEAQAARNFKAWVMSRSAYEGDTVVTTDEE